ncbi:MAG: hypothetical protein F4W96_04105 [Chloroflexi bacterium]|nr:hypothetical protein [Chloroflexota bacterium]
MLALVVMTAALFGASMSTSAQTVVRYCGEGGTILQGATAATNACEIAVPAGAGTVSYAVTIESGLNAADGDAGAIVDVSARDGTTGRVTVTASEQGNDVVVVTRTDSASTDDPTTTSYPITVLATLAISLGDSDNVFKANSQVGVTIVALHRSAASFVDWVRVGPPGPSIRNGEPAGAALGLGTVAAVNDNASTPFQPQLIIPAGTPDGTYTVSAQLSNRADASTAIATDGTGFSTVIEADFMVGDAGLGLASATLSLGVKDNKGTADTTDDVAETGSVGATNTAGINLVVEAFNSIGNKANGDDVSAISVIATGGSVLVNVTPDAADTTPAPTRQVSPVTVNAADLADDINQRITLNVTKTNQRPGMVSVYVLLSGPGGAVTSNTVDLNFTGAAAAIALGDATNTEAGGKSEFTIAGSDSGGNGTGVTNIVYNTKNADGTPVGRNSSTNGISAELGTVGQSTETEADDNPRAQAVIVTVGPNVKPGMYTIEVSLVGVAGSAQSTTVTVAGRTATIDVSASQMTSMTIGDVITVTATLSDEDGNLVADGRPVTFSHSTNTGLAVIGTGHGDDGRTTKGGSASVKYAVVGAGTSVISATAGDSGATGVAVVISTAGQTGADTEEAVSLDCLSSTTGFSSYTCSMGSTAAELFGMLSSRGATAIHLWNGSMWVRYADVDGAEIPGSSDFTVAEDDILYISN